MPEPLLPLYEAYVAAVNEANAANAKAEAAMAAYVAAAPEGVEFSPVPDHPPLIKVANGRIEIVTKPFLGVPYETGA
jgi:hypothetical protein